jgi:hypothetical protein
LISKKHRGCFAKFSDILINELVSNGKGRGPGPLWTDGGTDRGCRSTAAAHRSTSSGRSGAPKLTGGGATEREEHGELGSGLTGARVAAWRPGDGGAESEAAALGEREARPWREAKRGSERCGELRGWCSPFIGVGGAPGRGGRGVNADVNGFNAIEDGGGFKRGIKGGKMKAGW